jgi:ATP-dependent helicase/DNAse subunit B
MAQNVSVLTGPARSGKTRRLIDRFRQAIRDGLPGQRAPGAGQVLWIAPTGRAAAAIREQLLGDDVAAILGPGVTTFDGLTARILAEVGERFWPVDETAMRRLVRRVIRQATAAKRLDRFHVTADSAGFVDAVVQHFRELKRREIEPQFMAQAPPRRAHADEDRVLATLYHEYQSQLFEHGLADREGCHWIARDRLASGACASLNQLSLVVVDGFTDFTPTQHDVLRMLADRSAELIISLPTEEQTHAGKRHDLFAKTTQTLESLKHSLPRLQIRAAGERPIVWPAIDYIATNLFRSPREIAPPMPAVSETLARCEIIAAAGHQDELRQIARRIKRRLVAGDERPGDIVVVFRVLNQAARIREVFDEFGIPSAIDARERLLHAPVVKCLLALLRLTADDWPFRRLVAVLTNYNYSALDESARRAAEWLVRELQIATGREPLLKRCESLAAAGDGQRQSPEHERRTAAATAAWPLLNSLASALDELPKKAGLVEWSTALAQLGRNLGLSPFVAEKNAAKKSSADESLAAWQVIERQLAALAEVDRRLGEPPSQLDVGELLRLLVDLASHESLPQRGDDTGRVRVLSATAARTVSARHLYLAGLSEQAFPLPEPGGRLYSEEDYQEFQRIAHEPRPRPGAKQADAASAATVRRSQEEMLLFYELLTRAEERLTISYPALDDKAQSIPPSPYLTEIERLLDLHDLKIHRVEPQLAPVPPVDSLWSPADCRVAAVGQALEGHPQLLAALLQEASPTRAPASAIEDGLRIVHERARREEFGGSEGLLLGDAVRQELHRRFGPRHLWSPSQWERYAVCPYQFFLRDVLGLAPLGELTLETDFGRRGGMLHNVLARFHREWHSQPANERCDQEKFTKRLLALVAEEAQRGTPFGVEAALTELDRRQLGKWVDQHFDHLTAYAQSHNDFDEPLVPTHFELSFGPARASDDPQDASSTDTAFEFDLGGEKVRVAGRIDRIDVGKIAGQTVFSIIDYKTGKMTSLKREHIESGERLQLSVYVAAAQALLFDGQATPVAAGYWTMDRGFDAKSVLNVRQQTSAKGAAAPDLSELHQLATDSVKGFVTNIRAGAFPVCSRDENCTGRCEFHTVCRITQIRSLDKTWAQTPSN